MNPCSNSCFKVLGVSQFMAANTLEFDGSVETPSADMTCLTLQKHNEGEGKETCTLVTRGVNASDYILS